MVGQDGSVTIETAAKLMHLEVREIRRWSAIGSLHIERFGDEEMVHLSQVKALTRSPMASAGPPESRDGVLRGLLREPKTADTESVTGLQELARERSEPDR